VTTVIGVARDGLVHMAGDTTTNVYDRPIPGGVRKILRLETADGFEVMVGISGDGALAGIADCDLEVPAAPAPGADPQRWAHLLASRLTQAAMAAGCVEDGRMSGSVLLGWDGRLWTLAHAQAIPMPDGIGAIGSGEGIAIGAVDALLSMHVPPGVAVLQAVRIACRRDRYSAEPIQEETLYPPAPPVPAAAVRKKRGRRG
jgi:ATP-dependent protease HslVU (ClpYQ) peptidase subunit